ncbi:MAG: dipeptidase [Candidatus Zixiibacteriota bacterium]
MRRFTLVLGLALLVTHCAKRNDLHFDALVADLHSDAVLRMMEGADFGTRDTAGDMDIPRLRDGGIDLQVMACWLSTTTPLEECRPHVDSMLDSLMVQLDRYPDEVAVCRTAADAERIIASNKTAVFIGIENGVAIANDTANLRHFYERGVRYMTLTHTASNDWCISSADTAPAFQGLTDLGRDIVRKMNELGMIVDISHASPTAVDEVLEITTDPIIASHSCVYALCKHDRNLTDDQIRAIAANGGVIGINFYNGYLSDEWNRMADSLFEAYEPTFDSVDSTFVDDKTGRRAARAVLFEEIERKLAPVGVNVATVVDHIDYIVKLVGPDHVALGSDFDGVFALPAGLDDCTGVPRITEELLARAYSEGDIRKILGGNFMRVFRQVCD